MLWLAPIGLVPLIAGLLLIRRSRGRSEANRLDALPGAGLALIGVALLLAGLYGR